MLSHGSADKEAYLASDAVRLATADAPCEEYSNVVKQQAFRHCCQEIFIVRCAT